MDTIGARIRQVRKVDSLTLTEFGNRIGITAASVSAFELGKTNPSDQTIRSICREFKVNEIWLRTGDGEMHQAMTENEELAAYAGDVLAAAPDDIRKRFLAAQAKWTPDMWAVFAKIVDSFTETKKPDTE